MAHELPAIVEIDKIALGFDTTICMTGRIGDVPPANWSRDNERLDRKERVRMICRVPSTSSHQRRDDPFTPGSRLSEIRTR